MTLLWGVEVSCTHFFPGRKKVELHVVVINYAEQAPALEKICRRNQSFDQEAYINTILDKLRLCGIGLGNYQYLPDKIQRDSLHRQNDHRRGNGPTGIRPKR